MTRRSIEQYDFKRGLFDEILLKDIKGYPRRQTFPRRAKIKSITIHHMMVHDTDNGGACLACINIWRTREASSHYCIDKKVVVQTVYDNAEAWGNANTKGNQESVIVEHANESMAPNYEIDEETLKTSAEVVAGLHIIHGLGRPWSKFAFTRAALGTVKTHQSWYNTACPGPYFKKNWDRYMKMVQAAYDRMVKTPVAVDPPKPVPAPTTPEVPVTKVAGLHWNIADDDTSNGYKAENATRGDDVGRYAKALGFEVFLACEAGDKSLLKGIDTVLDNRWSGKDKSIWVTDRELLAKPRRYYGTGAKWIYQKRNKYGAAIFGIKNGKKFAFLEVHTDYRSAAKQAKQLASIFSQFIQDCDDFGVHRHNVVVAGDFNWDGTSADNPFKSLERWNFHEKGNKDVATFIDGRHLDGILAHANSSIQVTRYSRANASGVRLSDHFPLKFILELR